MNDSWYVLHTLTGTEQEAADWIKRHGTEAHALRRVMLERRGGEWRDVTRPLLPGYVLLKCRMDRPLYYAVRGAPGVIRLLGMEDGRLPAPVPSCEMEVMETLLAASRSDVLGISCAQRTEQGEIRFLSGPLKRLEEQIASFDIRRMRATVGLTLMGRRKQVDLALRMKDKHG